MPAKQASKSEKNMLVLYKVYRNVQELGVEAFTEPSFGKFKELFRIKYRTFNDFS